jgi:hypothetical protein
MQAAFVELEGKDGHVLLPKTATVLSIREEGADSGRFWIECVHAPIPANPVYVEKKSFLVNGPKETILERLGAETTGSDPVLRKQLAQANARADRSEAELLRTRASLDAVRLDHAARVQLDTAPGQWDDPNQPIMSCPALWSSYRLTTTADRHARLFAVALGQIGQGFHSCIGRALTNLKEGGRVPGGGRVTCYGLKLEFLRGHPEDIARLKAEGSLAFDFSQTAIDICALGAMQWRPDGLTGHYQFAESDSVIPFEDAAVEEENVTAESPVFAGLLAAGQVFEPGIPTGMHPPLPPGNFALPPFGRPGASRELNSFGRGGVVLASPFSVLLQGVNFDYRGEDVVVRITLAINHDLRVEIG